jgi:glycosyltransferase involved in cell wall biosynthesis
MLINLSVVIPCYNEEKTISVIVERIKAQKNLLIEIIIIDDHSNDNTLNELSKIAQIYPDIKIVRHEKNMGKGSALKSGIKLATGNIILIQDADLEYNPNDYKNLLQPFLETDADVVYGTRFKGGSYVRLHFFWHYLANKILTTLTNVVTNLNMSDMETGYKLFKSEVIKKINLKENSFGIEPEITVKLAKNKFIFYEVPISYNGRSYQEGKKITFLDAIKAIFCIFKYRFFD